MRIVDIKKDFKANKTLYLMILPILVFFLVFNYFPMAGVIAAFQNFSLVKGLAGSEWVGLDNFINFFSGFYFKRVISNTIILSFYDLIFAFPAPIIFALLLNEIKNKIFKKTVQTITYMPFFISLVVICGLIVDFTSADGLITHLISQFTGVKTNLLANPANFRTIFIGSNIWQNVGFQSIIYLAALAGIDQELYEASRMDGAGRFKQLWHITIPSIMPTIIIFLILRIGSMMSVSFEKIILLYSPMTYETADVISSYVYRKGLLEFNYSYSTAVGLFNSVVNFFLLVTANFISKKHSETSLF